jgi:adenylate cyclase
MYGLELMVQATDTILRGAPRHSNRSTAAQLHVLLATLVLAGLVAAAALRGAIWGIAAAVLGVAAALISAVLSARNPAGLWLWHAWPLSPFLTAALLAGAAGVGYRQLQEARELRRVRQVFDGYVGDEVLQKLGGRMPEMGGETEAIAVLFCDIAGFSALAENMRDDPQQLMKALNQHFEPLVLSLKDRGAYVDNYVGDLIMALFGAPESAGSLELNTRAAVLAAVDFVRIVDERNAAQRAAGDPVIDVGIGVHCGTAVVGNLGSPKRMKYTAIGDTVNIASRVESNTRKFDTRLLVTEEVMRACAPFPEIVDLGWEFAAETQVKGRVAPVRLYRCKAAS